MIAMARFKGEEIVSLAVADPTQLLESFSFSVSTEGLSSEDECVLINGKDVKISCDSARGRAYCLNKN